MDLNKEYWTERVLQATKQIEEGNNYSSVSMIKEKSETYQIHTDDVSLKNQSQIFFPCIPENQIIPIPIYCTVIDIAWGGNTTTKATASFLPVSFLSEHLGKVCLERSVNHDLVVFSFDVDFEQTNVLGNTEWSHSQSYNNAHLNAHRSNGCALDSEIRGINAGGTLSSETHLESLITVRG